MVVVGGSWRLCVGYGGCVWVVVVVGGSWWLWQLCGGHGGCVGVMAVVCGSWRLCVGHGGCRWVVVVVCGSWWLCVGHGGCGWVMVCESWCVSRESYLRMLLYVKYQRLQTFKANLGAVRSQEDRRLFHIL